MTPDENLADLRKTLRWICRHAYDYGLHELGYDPVSAFEYAVRAAPSPGPTGTAGEPSDLATMREGLAEAVAIALRGGRTEGGMEAGRMAVAEFESAVRAAAAGAAPSERVEVRVGEPFGATCPECGEWRKVVLDCTRCDAAPGAAPADGTTAIVAAFKRVEEKLAALAPASPAVRDAAAYEQAAKWCEDRAEKIRQRGRERPAAYGGDAEGIAEWIRGCADTIRHHAAALAAEGELAKEAT